MPENYFWIIIFVILMIIAVFPKILDIFLSYRSSHRSREILIKKAAENGLTAAELKMLLADIDKSPSGTDGLSRLALALAIAMLIGIMSMFLLSSSANTSNSDIIKTIIDILAGTLATITGFYFGGRTAVKGSSTSDSSTVEGSRKKSTRKETVTEEND